MEADLQQLKGLIPGLSGDISQVNKALNFNEKVLKTVVPVVADLHKKLLAQIEIMHEAAKYIDQLQSNLVCHIRTHGYPDKMRQQQQQVEAARSSRGAGFEDSESIKKNLDSYIASGSKSWSK